MSPKTRPNDNVYSLVYLGLVVLVDLVVCEGGLGWWFEATLLCKSQVWIWVPNAYLVWSFRAIWVVSANPIGSPDQFGGFYFLFFIGLRLIKG